MKGIAKRKVKGGKLIEVELWYTDTIIEKAIISGDFFLIPGESIEDLENALVGLDKNATPVEIEERLNKVIFKKNIELIGFTEKDLAETVWEALK
jgi:hypothetical protein